MTGSPFYLYLNASNMNTNIITNTDKASKFVHCESMYEPTIHIIDRNFIQTRRKFL